MNSHITVMRDQAITALSVRAHGIYVDATFGRGGHSAALLRALAQLGGGRVIALDRDPAAIAVGQQLAADPQWLASPLNQFQLHKSAFEALAEVLRDAGLGDHDAIDGVLFDLGVSSPQIDTPERGFSFRNDGPLDMRMDPSSGESAAEWMARASVAELKEVIKDYGEERHAGAIATAIVTARATSPISTTGQFAAIVAATVRTREPGQHPATRSFQAVRIYINRELAQLALALPQALSMLKVGGRLVVISFHSLEDRIVKRFMQHEAQPARAMAIARLPLREAQMPQSTVRLVGRTERATDAEVAENPRARSAIMRVAERLPA